MGEVKGRRDINDELNKLYSERIDERSSGLNKLIHIIRDKRLHLKEVNDTGYHTILESVFRVAKIETSNYARATKYTKPKVESRLSSCAALIRVVVEVGLRRLRYKTVKALLEHVTQTLPTADAGYCEPLCKDYLKALVCLLEFAAHAEHLHKDEWRDVVDFCVEAARNLSRSEDTGIPHQSTVAANLRAPRSNRDGTSRAGSPSISGEHGRASTNSVSQAALFPRLRDCQLEIALCLQLLTTIPNAPVLEKADDVVTVIEMLLSSYSKVSSIQHVLLNSIDSIMCRVIANDIEFAVDIVEKFLPLFRRFWEVKDNLAKESLLVLLCQSEILLSRLVSRDSIADSKAELGALVETLRDDYCARRSREQLHLNDVSLCDPMSHGSPRPPLSIGGLQLRVGNVKAEHPWYLLSISASVLVALEKDIIDREQAATTEDIDHPHKRLKMTHPVDDILHYANGYPAMEKLYALQILVFVFEQLEFDEYALVRHLDVLLPCLSDDDGSITSWAMIAMSSAAGQRSAGSLSAKPVWSKVWRLSARHVTYASTCRASCHLMSKLLGSGLVQIADVADIANGMTRAVDLNGPAECNDSALTLWTMIIVLGEQKDLSIAPETAGSVLHWLYSRWNPANLGDRQHATNIAQHCSTFAIMRLICVCLGLPVPSSRPEPDQDLGTLSQTRFRALRDRKMLAYLLTGHYELPNQKEECLNLQLESAAYKPPNSRIRFLAAGITDFLLSESSALLRRFVASTSEPVASITTDTIHITTSYIIIGYALLKSSSFENIVPGTQLLNRINELNTSLRDYVRNHTDRRELIKGFLDTLNVTLGSMQEVISGKDLLTNGAIWTVQGFDLELCSGTLHLGTPSETHIEQDEMDPEDNFDSQGSFKREHTTAADIAHFEIVASTTATALRACTTMKIYFMSKMGKPEDARASAPLALTSVVENLTSLPGHDFLLCQKALLSFLDSDIPIRQQDADMLLQYLAHTLLRQYEFERSEVSMGVILDVMTRLSEFWVTNEISDVAEIGYELYSWFIQIALRKGISSPHVHIHLSILLQRIIKVRSDFGQNVSRGIESARTHLFEVLKEGNVIVKYHIANNIADLFGLFVLTEHEKILLDVHASLPSDDSWIEGIAIRLFTLAGLAASWSTLLRQCIYRILECPDAVPESSKYANSCLEYITMSLKLPTLHHLFRLFAPQILFTWLGTKPLRSLPYAALGYATLSDLLNDVQDEVVGEIIMQGKDDDAAQMAKILDMEFDMLLEASFSKSSAYCIARDIALPLQMPKKEPQLAPHAESRLRNALGKERYASLITTKFPQILAILFKTMMKPDAEVEKGFRKHSGYSTQYACYQQIISKSGPEKALPPSQQPSFNAKFIFDEIEFLCRRTPHEAERLWKPELYIYVFREVMSSINPALGSLHACSVLRKIRILVSFAGVTALQQYPLEMALHSLKLYLTETQCADEAIGVVEYLLEHSVSYLETVPAFLAGYAVSTLTSMREFFDATQDSTTQESQFKATMSRAQTFHTWFSEFLKEFNSPRMTEESAHCFKTIIKAASHIQTGGNARIGTYESELLLELLEDERSGRNLLDRACQNTILRFLCTSFEVPSRFRDDIFGSDEAAATYASVVWKTCQRGVSSPNYLLWAGRVLGRAYACKGLIDREMVSEALHKPSLQLSPMQTTTLASSSRLNILSSLSDLLRSEQSSEVGKAEATLRAIITNTYDTDDHLEIEQFLSDALTKSLVWKHFHPPESGSVSRLDSKLSDSAPFRGNVTAKIWIQQLSLILALTAKADPILSGIVTIIETVEELAETTFSYILHLVLLQETGGHQLTREIMSKSTQQLFHRCIGTDKETIQSSQILLQAILYLRTQPLPNETTKADRDEWLDLDYRIAAAAAVHCSMYKTALLFIEIHFSQIAKLPRRSSAVKMTEEPTELLLAIYGQIDEQDAFYGVQQPSSLFSMMAQLEYENAGFKNLSFRGAHYDGQLRLSDGQHQRDEESMVRALDSLDLHGLSQSLLGKIVSTSSITSDSILRSARKLEQWDISAPVSHTSGASTIYRAFQGISNASDSAAIATSLNRGFSDAMSQLMVDKGAKSSVHATLGCLATLTEADEIFSSTKSDQLHQVLGRFEGREDWMHSESFEHIKNIISCRETTLSLLSKNPKLQDLLKTTQRDARSLESRLLLSSSKMSRLHGASQNALSTVTYLTELVGPCKLMGIDISAAVQLESAYVLWGQGEMTASIRMLQDLSDSLDPTSQLIQVGKSELLATLGHQISEARLEKPDEIINHYLSPALGDLRGLSDGDEAGKVFHEFASFCDQQLQNPDGLEDYQRIQKLRERKEAEVEDLNKMMRSANSQARERDNLKSFRDKAKKWFELDDREYQRLRESRQTFLRQSLENYLLCLKACDGFDNDALRFSALWLENHDNDIANAAVAKHIGQVGSRKFASLMNQWSSRLLESPGHFQTLLASLVLRICVDHPYHGMYQVFAGSKSKGGKDNMALARHAAATNIVNQLKDNKRCSGKWLAIHNANIGFVRFATERLEEPYNKPGSKVLFTKSRHGGKMAQDVPNQRIPPPTAKIELRADCDYSSVPLIARFQPEFAVASGISMPKIATAIGTNGIKYKLLFKGGNDDLRQDAIMEQVFEQVSNLLRSQRVTRQRNLGIRTYKVLPLTANAGIMEFVTDTIPLHDYLMPAHQRHFPKDAKPSACRKQIADAQNKSVSHRIKAYLNVCDHFHPVLRYFFMERFDNPDDWFEKRLAYTRSTAAISILGHILGLGDRHGHNILLDEKTGEVVYIDLGIAFEQGRILPVPEVVPFRLTRDLVDGMGITKTEGVFRRCCEFTLEALRNESYSIVTILDVLRYDPLYSWSLSPLRLKKMQDAQTDDPKLPGAGQNGAGRGEGDEPGEADRALTVVKKKLSKSLSVQATVNELIQMATDERNLAVLYCGWAAYV